MDVTFWYDPACPFCWMTSRWITSIKEERDLRIDWQPISLLFKNEPPEDSPFYRRVARSRDLLRVAESLRAAGDASRIGDWYTAVGTTIHMEQGEVDVAATLTGMGLDPTHAAAADDASFDDEIRRRMGEGIGLTGDDVGTPLIAVDGRSGRTGLFGPVITRLPKEDDALRLWDGFVAMAETPGFFELKRTRTGAPDMTTITG